MLSKIIIIKCCDITKIKKFENAVVVYTKDNYYVCDLTQKLPQAGDLFIKLTLKGKCEK